MKKILLILTTILSITSGAWAQSVPTFTATNPESLADGWYQIKWITTNGASDYTDAEVEGKFVTNYPGDVTVNNKKYSLFLDNAPTTLDEHAKTFVYLEGRVSDYTAGSHGNLRSANGHYISRTGESSTTKPDANYIIYVSRKSYPDNSTITSSTSAGSRISLEPQGKNATPYIGQTNSTEKFPMVQFSPVDLSYIGLQAWTVNIEGAKGTETVSYNGAGTHYGISTVYNNGTFFFAQGVTPNASDFTCNLNDNPYKLFVNNKNKTIEILPYPYAGSRNINDGYLNVNGNNSTISKNSNGDIVLNNETGFNTTGNTSPLTTISFRITLDTPTSFTKIFTYSVTNDWTTSDGKVGIGINSSRQLEGLWNGSEWNTLTTDALSAGEHIITVTIGESNNSYGTRVYVDGGSTFYSASGLKTSNTTYKYILINSDIANKINALYVYNYALSATGVNNVVSAINALPTQVNEKCYIIKDHSNNNLNVYYDGTNEYVCINTTSGNNDNYKWSIYTIDEKSFLYNIGAGKFVCQVSGTGSGTSWPLKADEAYDMTLTKHENTNQFNYYTIRSKFCKGNQDYLHYNNTYTYGSTNWSDDAGDSKWRIIEVGELSQDQQQTIQTAFENAHLSDAQVTTAKGNINRGVGYPKETTDTYKALNNLSTNTKLYDSEHETVVDIDNIVTAYKEETDVELPVNGKAYYIINGQCNSSNIMEPNKYVLYNNSNNIAAKAYSTTLDESCIWVVRKISEGYYALVSATGNGGYLHWTDNNASNTPLVTTYSAENQKDKTIMHIAKIVHSINNNNVTPENNQLFGYLSLRGFRAGRNDGADSPIIFKGAEAAFDATVEDIVSYSYGSSNAQFSSAVQFVEATDYTANQVSLKAPKKTDGKTYSSIYLPYPVKVPEGVTAYYCTLNENSLHLEDIGEKIPAQTGAILIGGTEASTQTLVPATTETTSENVSDNVLSGVLTNTVTSNLGSRIYVLNGGQSAGIGFYPYSQTATLTANKAYYNASAQGARDFYLFGSDDSSTGIEGLSEDVDNQNETFDNTRKVLLDGKVVVVRNGKKYSITGQIYK